MWIIMCMDSRRPHDDYRPSQPILRQTGPHPLRGHRDADRRGGGPPPHAAGVRWRRSFCIELIDVLVNRQGFVCVYVWPFSPSPCRPSTTTHIPRHPTTQHEQGGRGRGRHRELLLALPPIHARLHRGDRLWEGHRLPAVGGLVGWDTQL